MLRFYCTADNTQMLQILHVLCMNGHNCRSVTTGDRIEDFLARDLVAGDKPVFLFPSAGTFPSKHLRIVRPQDPIVRKIIPPTWIPERFRSPKGGNAEFALVAFRLRENLAFPDEAIQAMHAALSGTPIQQKKNVRPRKHYGRKARIFRERVGASA